MDIIDDTIMHIASNSTRNHNTDIFYGDSQLLIIISLKSLRIWVTKHHMMKRSIMYGLSVLRTEIRE